MAYSLIPGKHRLNLHAIYAETGGKPSSATRSQPEHFAGWIEWAKAKRHGLDFNPTFFSHPKAADGFTLASYDAGIRKFWIEHCIACRKIGEVVGRAAGHPCVTNVWIPDGFKDIAVDRKTPRSCLLRDRWTRSSPRRSIRSYNLDAVEGKLFGIGSESYVVGSHEFYLGYAVTRRSLLSLDAGHYHPTEAIADKLSAVLSFVDEVLLHVSRRRALGQRSRGHPDRRPAAIAQELVRGDYLDRVHIGLDYFDASINRIAAWVIGARNMLRALLLALLEPVEQLRKMEIKGDYTARLACWKS